MIGSSTPASGPSFAPLQAAYDNRLVAARLARQAGQPVVGYLGNTVPVELIIATGAMPVRIAPVAGDPARSDAFVEHFSDRDTRLIFSQYCDGALDFLDLLVIPRSTESQHKLYLALREARRTGITSQGPALWLYDILHTQRESSRAYGLARTHELVHKLTERCGTAAPNDATLARAVTLTNAVRTGLQTLQQRRLTRSISGRQALVATGAMRFMAPQAGHDALHAWLAADEHLPARGPRLLVTGVSLDHSALHAQVEAAGADIVCEDDEWGTRAAEPLVATDRPPLEAVFDHCFRGVPCVRRHPADDVDGWLASKLDARTVDGVLFYLPAPEDIHGWQFPAQRDRVAAAGLPWLKLRRDARDGADPALADFIATLGTPAAAR